MWKIIISCSVLIVLRHAAFVCADKVIVSELTNNWKLRNEKKSIDLSIGKIPSGVYTALSALYGDVLQSTNDVDLRWIAYENWTFVKSFNVKQSDFKNVRSVNLTLHGVDTVSTVRLNGVEIGSTDNMFVRYSFDVLPYLKQENVLEIEITSPVWAAKQRALALEAEGINTPPDCPAEQMKGECHRNMLRKMQMSFGSNFGLTAPSMGIWNMVALEYYEVAILRDVDVALRLTETHWIMSIQAFLSTGIKEDFGGELSLYAPYLLKDNPYVVKKNISYASPVIRFTVDVPKDAVELWWPNGYGKQKLYPLLFTFKCWLLEDVTKVRTKSISQKSVRIGFRTLELVEDLDEFGRSFYFKVNGHPIFMKGVNYVPSHILPEQSIEPDRIKHLLESAHNAHMNMIRVWGGGLYQSNYFYELADHYGLLVWQDMAFTAAAYPMNDDFVESVSTEVSQNFQRIAYHPSLALITTNDEIELYLVKNRTDLGLDAERLEREYQQLFLGTIKHELNGLMRYDNNSRPGPMISTPSNGIEEAKKGLAADPQNPNFGDVHFWDDEMDVFDPDIYPQARFISEYGFQSLPVMTSWQNVKRHNDNVVDLIKHRQHDSRAFKPMFQMIERQLPGATENWEENVEGLIYLSQLAQAMSTKIATEKFRSQRVNDRTMGALYWQLNDVWVAPSWSSIDFYGNYKLVYYWSKQFLAPISIIGLYDKRSNKINVTLTRDEITIRKDPRPYTLTIYLYLWSQLFPEKNITRDIILESNTVKQTFIEIKELLTDSYNVKNSFFELILTDSDKKIVSTNFLFPTAIPNTIGISDPELIVDISWPYCVDKEEPTSRMASYSLTVKIQRPAVFVFIEISHPKIKKYTLSHNGFVQVDPVKIVHLEYEHSSECVAVGAENIKVMTLNQFLNKDVTVKITNSVDLEVPQISKKKKKKVSKKSKM